MLTGTNLKYAKNYNVRIILETIRIYGPVSRSGIAKRTELTAQTVSNITRELMDVGLVSEANRLQEGRGAPSILLELNSDGAFSVGLDLDKDHLSGILMDLTGNVRQRVNLDLNFPTPDEAMDLFEHYFNELIRKENVSKDKIWGLGIGLPGPLGITEGSVVTNMVNPKALPGWNQVPVLNILKDRLSVPVYLENNASAAALGERWYGAGRHIGTFFYLYFGAGLGGGLIIQDQIYPGHTGNAGELGYFPVARKRNGKGHSHLGEFYNLPSLYEKLRKNGYHVHNPEQLLALFEDGNELVMNWIDKGIQQLAPMVLGIEYLMDPEAIFLGGRLPEPIIKRIHSLLEASLPDMRFKWKTYIPELKCAVAGPDAAALGLATVPLYTTFAPIPTLVRKKQDSSVKAMLESS